VEHWTSHPPQEQKTRVRIPSGYKVFGENICSNVVDFISIVCDYLRNKGIGHKKLTKQELLIFFLHFFITGISDTVPRMFLLHADSNTSTFTRHHYHHFPTLSLEHLQPISTLPPYSYTPYFTSLNPNYIGLGTLDGTFFLHCVH
jgi:hypothetical protein